MGMPAVYPLIFTFREPIAGEAFVAGVDVRGKVVACLEDDGEWWFYGVLPGAMAEGGVSAQEAYARFTLAFRTVLADAAMSSRTFEDFKRAAERFVLQEDAVESERWRSALEAVRSGRTIQDAPFDDLPRLSGTDTAFGVEVVRLGSATAPTSSSTDQYSAGSQLLRPAA